MANTSPIIKRNNHFKNIAVIGGGIIGSTTALQLATLGYKVEIIDPELNQPIKFSGMLTGTQASLGVLMGYVFKRSKGRSWTLRKRSMELWPQLIEKLSTKKTPLKLDTPLIQLARSEHEAKLIEELICTRSHLGLAQLTNDSPTQISRSLPIAKYGGLISKNDGRINPLNLMVCLMQALDKYKVNKINRKVCNLKRLPSTQKDKWQLILDNKKVLNKDCVVICAALGSEALLKPLGHNYPIEPILGQAIRLTIKSDSKNWSGWPAVLTNHGINLIPENDNQLLIGATLEPGIITSQKALQNIKEISASCLKWMQYASVQNQWAGIRAKPKNEPAPLLKTLEQGLILNTAHYRNGILLAPACAEWVANELIGCNKKE